MKIKTRSCSIVLASTFLILFLILISSTASGATDQSASPTGPESITYNVVEAHYKCDSWSNEQYPLINLFEGNYTPLLANGDPIWRSHVNKLAKLVLDSNKKYTLKTGEKLDLGQDYTLEVKQIDIDGKKVWLEFDKNGQYVDDAIISTDSGNQTWICKLDKIQGEDNTNVLKVHVNQVFQGADDSIAQIDGVWLIDYANAKTLEVGDKIGEITLTQIINGVDESNLGSLVFERHVYAYITNTESNTVSVIDTSTNTVIATVNAGSWPWGVAVNPMGTKVYVTNCNIDTVSIIDTATNTVKGTVNVGTYPYGIAISPDGKKVYVANEYSNNVSVIDTATNTVTATVNVGFGPHGVAFIPDGTKVYVTDYDDSALSTGNVSVINTTTNSVTATINVGRWPRGIAVNPAGTKVYVANFFSNTVSIIDTATDTITDTVNVGTHPYGIAVTPDGTKVYIANTDINTVFVIDTATNTVTDMVNVGFSPYGVAVTPDGTKVYVANLNSNTVSIIGTATDTVTDTVDVGLSPSAFGQFISPLPVLEPLLPVANFSTDITEGNIPLSIQFTDLSENAVEWNWNFGDGITSTEQNPTHTYYAGGNYTVTLTVSNTDGMDSKLSKITVFGPVHLAEQNFSSNATNVYAPVIIQIGNLSQNANEINWNIGSQHLGTNFNGNEQNVSAPVTVQIGNASQNATTINWNIHA
jgi:S-layer protein (TIGR01567 family)